MSVPNVAIACQGGGTHAAFSWGVLDEILKTNKEWSDAKRAERFNITAITGTSAGALCALMVWYGLAPKKNIKGSGSIQEAIDTLDGFWERFAAQGLIEEMQNAALVLAHKLEDWGVPLPHINPYHGLDELIVAQLKLMGAREEYLSFDSIFETACPEFDKIDWPKVKLRALVGASEILSGAETVFDTRKTQEVMGIIPAAQKSPHPWRRRLPFELGGVAASGTLPTLLKAQEVGDRRFWDGLYSQNPPIRELIAGMVQEEVPDEIWIIRINPQDINSEPTTIEGIRERENHLTGNLSLNKELDFINFVNNWIVKPEFAHMKLADKLKPITVRTIKMTEKTASELRKSSKMDRDSKHIIRLREEGISLAQAWLNKWPNCGVYPTDLGYYN